MLISAIPFFAPRSIGQRTGTLGKHYLQFILFSTIKSAHVHALGGNPVIFHVYADYAPPRSWEQFEELCADVFQSAWSDPAIVRHGRAGQRQHGVDIVARNGALYPIGLQCKKRAQWPVTKITKAEIDVEVAEALNFDPPLKAFYILTTAPDDVRVLEHVRGINERHRIAKLFEVVLLGWNEIVRRATLDQRVADKHFGPTGGGTPRSPLLATWMMSGGRLEKAGAAFALDVEELVQDLQDWPAGHFVIRQRESDALIEKLRFYESRKLSDDDRKKRIALRKQLRVLTEAENRAVNGVKLMLTDPDVSVWLLKVWEPSGDAPVAVESYVNNETTLKLEGGIPPAYLRMSPQNAPDRRCTARLSKQDVFAINALMSERQKRYGASLTDTVAELPEGVRARIAEPRIVRGILEFVSEERLTWDEIRKMGALDIGSWKVSLG